MPTYSTPGVYIEEVAAFPPSVAPVATAIPAFVGYTEKAVASNGDSLLEIPTRITSLLEYQQLFGLAPEVPLAVKVVQNTATNPDTSETIITSTTVSFDTQPTNPPKFVMWYALRMYFANGGGPCYIVSMGEYGTDGSGVASIVQSDFEDGLDEVAKFDEPTLLVFPDACDLADHDKWAAVAKHALKQCTKLQDRFTIMDIRRADPAFTDNTEIVTNTNVTDRFRGKVNLGTAELKYGAAYFPYLKTSIPFHTSDGEVTIADHDMVAEDATVSAGAAQALKLDDATVVADHTALHAAVKSFLSSAYVKMPPSGAVAGAYARVDAARGVWKAPANVGLQDVLEPVVKVTNDLNDGLNIDGTGKSVNAIRAFTGKGTLIWGARTLAGNDNENRYVSVRRFLNFAEESIGKAVEQFVFEPNDAGTWSRVRSMIENFLTLQWRDGALMGAKPADAFYVAVGLNETMTGQDVLEGKMIVEIGLTIVRPAEFIILRFIQQMPTSG